MGVFSTHEEAAQALEELKAFGVADDNLSYVYANEDGDVKDAQTGEKMGDGAKTGAGTGAVIGAIAGLVVANGILPGIGTLFVGGPLAAALGFTGAAAAGAVTGAAAGGLIGALTNLGVNKEDADMYERHIKAGDVLVVARSTPDETTEDLFLKYGAKEVRSYSESQ